MFSLIVSSSVFGRLGQPVAPVALVPQAGAGDFPTTPSMSVDPRALHKVLGTTVARNYAEEVANHATNIVAEHRDARSIVHSDEDFAAKEKLYGLKRVQNRVGGAMLLHNNDVAFSIARDSAVLAQKQKMEEQALLNSQISDEIRRADESHVLSSAHLKQKILHNDAVSDLGTQQAARSHFLVQQESYEKAALGGAQARQLEQALALKHMGIVDPTLAARQAADKAALLAQHKRDQVYLGSDVALQNLAMNQRAKVLRDVQKLESGTLAWQHQNQRGWGKYAHAGLAHKFAVEKAALAAHAKAVLGANAFVGQRTKIMNAYENAVAATNAAQISDSHKREIAAPVYVHGAPMHTDHSTHVVVTTKP